MASVWFVCVWVVESLLAVPVTGAEPGVAAGLVINVSSGRADSVPYRQSLQGNTTQDWVRIEYVTPAGTAVTQLSDFRTGVTITQVTVPGEEDLAQPSYQVLCFVTASTADLISPEAMTKLRQKHPGTVRVAEESRGTTVIEFPVVLATSRASHLSRHLPGLCRESKDTLAPMSLLEAWRAGTLGTLPRLDRSLEAALVKSGGVWEGGSLARCANTKIEDSQPCVCVINNCVHWFPCSLKYCRNSVGEGEHRCGIRTCSKCTTLRYLAPNKFMCTWDQL